MGEGQPRLLDQVRDRIRRKHYSIRTEQDLRRLDPTLHIALQQATPARHGGGGDRGVPDPPRGGETRVGLVRVRKLHESDPAAGYGEVYTRLVQIFGMHG